MNDYGILCYNRWMSKQEIIWYMKTNGGIIDLKYFITKSFTLLQANELVKDKLLTVKTRFGGFLWLTKYKTYQTV